MRLLPAAPQSRVKHSTTKRLHSQSSILIVVYNNICFGCVKETSHRDVSFTHPKHMFDREKLMIIILRAIYFYVYLPIIGTTDKLKENL